MSGLRPNATGVYDNKDDWRSVIAPELTLTTTFRKAGYYVAGAGKIYHEAFRPRGEWDDIWTRDGGEPQPAGHKGVGGIRIVAVGLPR